MDIKVIGASRLCDGVSVWLDSRQDWSPDFSRARAFLDTEIADVFARAQRDEQANLVVDARVIEVERGDAGILPSVAREKMRAFGPSIATPEHGVVSTNAPPLTKTLAAAAGVYRYDEHERQFLRDRAAIFRDQVRRRLSGELSEDEFKPLRLMNGLYLQLHGYMLRVAMPYGGMSAAQMRCLAALARRFDRGYGHFTTRQNIQFNWIRLQDVPDILDFLAEADLHAIQTSGNCVRNVTTDHFAGAAADEIVDPRLYAEVLRQWSTDHPELTYLPRKFKIAMTGSPVDRAAVRVHDIGLLAYRNAEGETGFQVYGGGGLGRTPVIGVKVRHWLPEADLLRYVEAILRVYNAMGRRDNIYKARIKILIRDLKPDVFIAMIEDEFAAMEPAYCRLEPEIIAAVSERFVQPSLQNDLPSSSPDLAAQREREPGFSDWLDNNVFPHRQKGYRSVALSLKPPGGVPGDATADEMDLIADLAEKHAFGEIRVAHQQNLVLPHVREDALLDLWRSLRGTQLAEAHIGLITDIISCPGMDYCALATARSIPLAQRLSRHFSDRSDRPAIGPLDLHVSGCINACGHHHVAHIGLLGLEKNGEESYQITLGGSADEQAAIGEIVGPAFSADEAVEAVDQIVSVYLRERAHKETFIAFYRRVGAEPFKEALYARA
ncbi:nitrite reductase [Rhodoblastus sphagnicola]|uniref:Nitrite reductase n=1 Tax=Rhodoblastus sphagnicola TaxID=333368 RepID=A0A2S6NHA7_9HYPH|nr:DUF2849 domain-containing protein [Rhodoblastus sphagnicola]MBB4200870.1 sulfite reductase (NADPH) hemoprotein beta-component [Rhodoblastus sphagnicola]PPQ33981.1 nitrite reductase [Rhodoblastus sphagnicola]